MENKAHYALIGAFVLTVLFAVIGFIAWLSNAQLDQRVDKYEVSYVGGVQGMSQGTEVRFNGLKVGEVTRLRIDPNDTNSVLVDIEVEPGTPIDTKSIGRMEPLGLTGLNYIQIIPGGEGFPLIKDLPGKGPYRLVGEASRIDVLLGGGGNVIEAAQSALARVNTVMSDQGIADFHDILSNVSQMTGNLKDLDIDGALVERTLAAIEQAAKDVSAAANAVDVAANDFDLLINEDVKSALSRAEVSMAELDKALGSIGTAADGTGALITDSRDAINRLSNSGLTDLEETVDGLRRLIVTLGRVADSLERSPAQFIAGEERETVELPQ
ncbi:MlaD family protein [Hellea balneolensis]|uniref:MlaD family protein n=1 Tax=Hellea balneolensis TaxID=287478 RepID=UPI0003FEF941|nr:MlaD family protein [Hellea balneolensis]